MMPNPEERKERHRQYMREMSEGVEEIDNVQLMREVENEEDEITPYGAKCVADELESLRTQLAQERQRREQAEGLLREATPYVGDPYGMFHYTSVGERRGLFDRIDKHFGE